MPKTAVTLPVARGPGLVRAVTRLAFAAPLFLPAWWVLPHLRFQPSAVSNRLADYCWALVVTSIACCGLLVLLNGARWLAFAFWPAAMRVRADAEGLSVRLGPLGRKTYDWKRMTAVYRHELSVDEDDLAFADTLDPDEEMAHRLPILEHPEAREPLNVMLCRFANADEAEIAATLRAFTDGVRAAADHARQGPR